MKTQTVNTKLTFNLHLHQIASKKTPATYLEPHIHLNISHYPNVKFLQQKNSDSFQNRYFSYSCLFFIFQPVA